jgi:hypothetical protein
LFHAQAAAVDFPAGQRGDLWATAQHIVGTVNRWFYSSALDGITPSADREYFVTWWCHLIFITDPVAIQTAIGFVGGASLVAAVLIAIELLWSLLVLIRRKDG